MEMCKRYCYWSRVGGSLQEPVKSQNLDQDSCLWCPGGFDSFHVPSCVQEPQENLMPFRICDSLSQKLELTSAKEDYFNKNNLNSLKVSLKHLRYKLYSVQRACILRVGKHSEDMALCSECDVFPLKLNSSLEPCTNRKLNDSQRGSFYFSQPQLLECL